MNGFDRKAYMKEYSKAYRLKNKDKLDEYNKSWREENNYNKKLYDRELNRSEGIGVYKATYPSGTYIGSGLIFARRGHHLNGSSGVAKTLNEKAVSFEIICLTDTKEESMLRESEIIKQYGLDNLLNTKH